MAQDDVQFSRAAETYNIVHKREQIQAEQTKPINLHLSS